ncbi:MAG: DMT family transporter [Pseudomonadota bacterium]|nr:DMT family transporter [Pseudomonadota bacterium]
MATRDGTAHNLGFVLIALAALCWSTSGLFVRFIEADALTMLFWRGLFAGTAVFAYFFAAHRDRSLAVLRTLRWPALGVAVASATSMVCGISSLRYTTVAEALIIYATVPFVTAALARLVIGERAPASTLAAAGIALGGVGLALAGSDLAGNLTGNLLACVMAGGMAVMTVIMRRYPEVPMVPALGLSAWLSSGYCAVFAATLSISASDFVAAALFGVIQSAGGLVLYAIGSHRVPAAQATLIASLESPLAPFWVWLVFAETPSALTLAGGGIVLAAVFGHMIWEMRKIRALR